VNQGPSPTGSPFGQPPAPGTSIPEVAIGVLLLLLGMRSLVKWMRTEFAAESARDRILYAMHVAARVGLWFGFAAFFFGLALVDEPSGFTWFLAVPLALAGMQLITGVALGQGGGRGNGPVR
jgi:hypothetical protein